MMAGAHNKLSSACPYSKLVPGEIMAGLVLKSRLGCTGLGFNHSKYIVKVPEIKIGIVLETSILIIIELNLWNRTT